MNILNKHNKQITKYIQALVSMSFSHITRLAHVRVYIYIYKNIRI